MILLMIILGIVLGYTLIAVADRITYEVKLNSMRQDIGLAKKPLLRQVAQGRRKK